MGAGSNWIQVLKRHLHGLTGFSRFRQRLLYNSIQLEDAEIPPDGTLQLVILPLVEGHLEELFQMTRDDDVQQLEDLLQQQVDPNLMENGQTALHVAVQIGSSRCCSLLIEARADMHTTRFDHLSPLHLAVEEDQLEVLQVGMGQYLLIPFLVGYSHPFTSYFDVNYRGTIGFDPSPGVTSPGSGQGSAASNWCDAFVSGCIHGSPGNGPGSDRSSCRDQPTNPPRVQPIVHRLQAGKG